MERILLREYLDHPRTLALASLESDPDCSKENFEEAILKQIRQGLPTSFQKLEKDMDYYWSLHQQIFATSEDHPLYLELIKYLNYTTPCDKKTFLERYYRFTEKTKYALDLILEREHKTTIGEDWRGATLEQLKVSFKSLELEMRMPLLINHRYFSRTDFLDRVIAPLFEA
jgi:hypothetical protein